ncbi:MAG: hypothetical protein HQL57_03660 [Magnetococcales bacterium]|nr:hypothetical protein [Magnetococcales bacterium]MBF0156265.1 hypothetical protein [Magnetococcales bacterium]
MQEIYPLSGRDMATLCPIQEADLDPVCRFLHEELPSHIPVADWLGLCRYPWLSDKPDYGFHLRHEGRVVGVILGLYSERSVAGQKALFCNLGSWCVLPAWRRESLRLLLAALGRKGCHFTSLTPTAEVAAICERLGFRRLPGRFWVVPALSPTGFFSRRWEVVGDHAAIGERLRGQAAEDFRWHRRYPWLVHLALGDGGAGWSYLVGTFCRYKRLPMLRVLHASDPGILAGGLGPLAAGVRRRLGVALLSIPTRLVATRPVLAWAAEDTQPRLYRPPAVGVPAGAGEVDFLYSEMVALEL